MNFFLKKQKKEGFCFDFYFSLKEKIGTSKKLIPTHLSTGFEFPGVL